MAAMTVALLAAQIVLVMGLSASTTSGLDHAIQSRSTTSSPLSAMTEPSKPTGDYRSVVPRLESSNALPQNVTQDDNATATATTFRREVPGPVVAHSETALQAPSVTRKYSADRVHAEHSDTGLVVPTAYARPSTFNGGLGDQGQPIAAPLYTINGGLSNEGQPTAVPLYVQASPPPGATNAPLSGPGAWNEEPPIPSPGNAIPGQSVGDTTHMDGSIPEAPTKLSATITGGLVTISGQVSAATPAVFASTSTGRLQDVSGYGKQATMTSKVGTRTEAIASNSPSASASMGTTVSTPSNRPADEEGAAANWSVSVWFALSFLATVTSALM